MWTKVVLQFWWYPNNLKQTRSNKVLWDIMHVILLTTGTRHIARGFNLSISLGKFIEEPRAYCSGPFREGLHPSDWFGETQIWKLLYTNTSLRDSTVWCLCWTLSQLARPPKQVGQILPRENTFPAAPVGCIIWKCFATLHQLHRWFDWFTVPGDVQSWLYP